MVEKMLGERGRKRTTRMTTTAPLKMKENEMLKTKII